ncbi:MAG: tetratricopeptide repeat protein [Desulfosudis oleivorans]|nr:tetratricopeptide repeat protein [Desulfosudis oleivorans]
MTQKASRSEKPSLFDIEVLLDGGRRPPAPYPGGRRNEHHMRFPGAFQTGGDGSLTSFKERKYHQPGPRAVRRGSSRRRGSMRKAWILIAVTSVLAGCARTPDDSAILPAVPKGAQAVSLGGRPLFPAAPSSEIRRKYEAARKAAEADPGSADDLIWLGRWAAYAGDYREAIRVFTRGTEKFPSDARFFRHRGHRYISVREFGRAVRDLEKAVLLIAGKPDEIEPDGAPNPRGIPVSTLNSNIYYHLGLAYFLGNDLEKALAVYRKGLETGAQRRYARGDGPLALHGPPATRQDGGGPRRPRTRAPGHGGHRERGLPPAPALLQGRARRGRGRGGGRGDDDERRRGLRLGELALLQRRQGRGAGDLGLHPERRQLGLVRLHRRRGRLDQGLRRALKGSRPAALSAGFPAAGHGDHGPQVLRRCLGRDGAAGVQNEAGRAGEDARAARASGFRRARASRGPGRRSDRCCR